MVKRSPEEHVLNFYLTAPLDQIDRLQVSIRQIYRHRLTQHQAKVTAGKTANPTKAKAAPKKAQKKPAPKPKQVPASSEESAFGGKELAAS